MKIRQATDTDRTKLKQVKELLSEEQIEQRLKLQIEGKAVWLVAEAEGKLVGFVLVKWLGKPTTPDYPDLEDLFIHPDYRGQGVAGQLIMEAEKIAKAKGYEKIGMAVNPDPKCPAHRLYVKLGYKSVDGNQYVDGTYGGVKDWVIDMEKTL